LNGLVLIRTLTILNGLVLIRTLAHSLIEFRTLFSLSCLQQLDVEKEDSRPASQASAVSDKAAPHHADEQSSPVKADACKESIVSLTSEKKSH
jgi:hypothetical protein